MKKKKEEKKNLQKYLPIITLIIIGILLILIIGIKFFKKDPLIKGKFTYLGTYEEEKITNEYYKITRQEELDSIFPDTEVKKIDLENHNYILLSVLYDSCSEENLKPLGYTKEEEEMKIYFSYQAKCGVCAPVYNYYLLETEKEEKDYSITIDYQSTNNPSCDSDIVYKPLIYLYPTKEEEIIVKLKNDELLTVTYPEYKGKWDVIAKEDGTLLDKETKREYYGLFWEGRNKKTKREEEGFVVEGKKASIFLEEKLKVLGLTDKEANEFILFWYPILKENKYNYIRFETEEEINHYMPLEITPKPDTVIRILMEYEPLDKRIKVKEQALTTKERIGFTVVEWGGTKIN